MIAGWFSFLYSALIVSKSSSILRNGIISLDVTTCQAFLGKRRISLTTTESNLLAVLLENQGSIVTREELLSSVWGEPSKGKTHTTARVDTHIQRLRRKLGRSARRIRTVRGVGFELVKC